MDITLQREITCKPNQTKKDITLQREITCKPEERRVTVEQTKTMDLSPKKSQLKRREKQRGVTKFQESLNTVFRETPFRNLSQYHTVRQPWPTKQPTTT